VASGLFPVYEAERGEVVAVSPIRRRVRVEDYLRPQRRYAHLFTPEVRTDVLDRLQAIADRTITRFGLVDSVPEEAVSARVGAAASAVPAPQTAAGAADEVGVSARRGKTSRDAPREQANQEAK
jgi:hypothetical protein